MKYAVSFEFMYGMKFSGNFPFYDFFFCNFLYRSFEFMQLVSSFYHRVFKNIVFIQAVLQQNKKSKLLIEFLSDNNIFIIVL